MIVSINAIKELRAKTSISLNECKKALLETSGDVEQALIVLQKTGVLKAKDKISRPTGEGTIHAYIHGNGRMGVLVEIRCETDFAADSYEFRDFCERTALQIAAMNPTFVFEPDSTSILAQREIFKAQVLDKPFEAQTSIIEGKLNKWKSEVCLLNQESVVVPGKTIEELRTELVAKIGENVTIKRFVRWSIGVD